MTAIPDSLSYAIIGTPSPKSGNHPFRTKYWPDSGLMPSKRILVPMVMVKTGPSSSKIEKIIARRIAASGGRQVYFVGDDRYIAAPIRDGENV